MPISEDKITSATREIPRIQNALLQNALLEIRKLERMSNRDSINSNLFHTQKQAKSVE